MFIGDRLGTYVFFVDFIGHVDDEAVAEALKAPHRRCAEVRYLGSWPVDNPAGATPPRLDEADRGLDRLPQGGRGGRPPERRGPSMAAGPAAAASRPRRRAPRGHAPGGSVSDRAVPRGLAHACALPRCAEPRPALC